MSNPMHWTEVDQHPGENCCLSCLEDADFDPGYAVGAYLCCCRSRVDVENDSPEEVIAFAVAAIEALGGEAMSHDPMCPMVTGKPPFHDDVTDDCLFCPLIARVREDERNAAIEAVWRVMDHSLSCYTTGRDCLRCDVTGEIEALGGER